MKCNKCGCEFESGTICPTCGFDNATTLKDQQLQQEPQPANDANNGYNGAEPPAFNPHPMKWYKALLVILWIGIISNILSAYSFFSGDLYSGFTDQVYAALPALKSLDIFGGIYSVAITIFIFVTWLGLLNYKKHSPECLLGVYALNLVFYIIYIVVFTIIVSCSEVTMFYGETYIVGNYIYQDTLDLSQVSFSVSNIVTIVVSIGMIIVNFVYFKRRKELFVK